jgi:peptidoglycan/LPS O-acetylase OafA/YrhL
MVQTQLSGKPPGYIPALDGLRAISILLVVGSHAGLDHVLPGAFGVTLFFFISGYLITRQLCDSLAGGGGLRLGAFYARRMLRLMPAALSYIVLAGFAFGVAGGRITAGGWAAALFYGANYYDIWIGYKTSLHGVRHPFNILWSLAIEEHFYALWPAVLAVLWRKRAAIACLAAVCVAVLCWRVWLYEACFHEPWFGSDAPGLCGRLPANPQWRYNRLYMATDTRLDSIAYGAILAVAQASGVRPPKAALPAVALLLVSFLLPGSFARQVVRTSLQGVALLGIFPRLLDAPGRVARVLSAAPAVATGRLSYSLYLWHWGAFGLADRLAPSHGILWQAIALPLAAGLSLLSYQCIERPMLALRRRAGSHAPLTPLLPTQPETPPHATA